MIQNLFYLWSQSFPNRYDFRLKNYLAVKTYPLLIAGSSENSSHGNAKRKHRYVNNRLNILELISFALRKLINFKFSKYQNIFQRTFVPDDKISWSVIWNDYRPVYYTAEKLIKDKPVWADVENPLEIVGWNKLDYKTKVDRRSHMGFYDVTSGVPYNPVKYN